jgi:uncharacterized protein YdeI (YjbR/CyaY-like superfamily)
MYTKTPPKKFHNHPVKITEVFYAPGRRAWRAWLSRNHRRASDVWLVYYKKGSGKPRIPYNDAVEEALCYGWIDSTLKTLDHQRFAQRFSPRRPGSALSETNKERVRRLIRSWKMTRAGLKSIARHLVAGKDGRPRLKRFRPPADILAEIKGDPAAWRNFARFPASYKAIRVGWIDAARHRPAIYHQRLRYFVKMTAENKRFGMVR